MVKVSVIMYVHNNQIFLKESLESILNQTLDDFEVICVDDASVDDSLMILQEYQQQYNNIKIKSSKDGKDNALNTVINEINGEYLYITNPGCILDKEALKTFYENAEENNSQVAISDKKILYENNEEELKKSFNKVPNKQFNYESFADLTKIDLTIENKLFSTKFIKENNIKFSDHSVKTFIYSSIFKADNISYIKKALITVNQYYYKLTNKNDKRLFYIIPEQNSILYLFKEFDQLEKNKTKLYDNKMRTTLDSLNKISEEYKNEYYNKLREEYKQILLNDELNKDFLENISKHYRKFFEMVIISENYYEYELLKKTYYKMNDYYNVLIDRNYFKNAKEKKIEQQELMGDI